MLAQLSDFTHQEPFARVAVLPPQLQSNISAVHITPLVPAVQALLFTVCMVPLTHNRHFSKTGKMKFREFATAIPTKGNLEFGLQLASSLAAIVTKKDAFTDNASVNLMPLPDGSVLAMSGEQGFIHQLGPSCRV